MTRVGYDLKLAAEVQAAHTIVASEGATPCGKEFLRGQGAHDRV